MQESGLAWGVEAGFTPNGSSWFELTYLRQDSDINFVASGGGCPALNPVNCTSSLAVNYIHAGGRWEFGHKAKLHPFLGAGLGVTIFDIGTPGVGSNTDFSISGQAGVRYMFGKAQRVGLRGTFRGWWSFVPNGQAAAWCGWYGCFAQEASSTVAQGDSPPGSSSSSESAAGRVTETPGAARGFLVMGWVRGPIEVHEPTLRGTP